MSGNKFGNPKLDFNPEFSKSNQERVVSCKVIARELLELQRTVSEYHSRECIAYNEGLKNAASYVEKLSDFNLDDVAIFNYKRALFKFIEEQYGLDPQVASMFNQFTEQYCMRIKDS